MAAVGFLFGALYLLGILFGVGALVYFIVKRTEDKNEEKFEKRDN